MKLVHLKQNYLVLVSLFLLLACNRKNKDLILAEGQVTDAITGNPVPNATIEIRSEERSFCFLCFGYQWYKTIELEKQSNEDGRFGFAYEGREKIHYALGGRSDTHYFHEDSSYVRLEKGKNNRNLRLFLNPYAWVKIHIKNELPLDTARIWVEYIRNFNGLGLKNFSGDSVVYIKSEDPGIVQVRYGLEKKNQSIHLTDSIAFINGDTTVLEIKY